MQYPKGCHATLLDELDAIVKITQPTNLRTVRDYFRAQRPKPVAIRPRGSMKWTVFDVWGRVIVSGRDLDVLRAMIALSD